MFGLISKSAPLGVIILTKFGRRKPRSKAAAPCMPNEPRKKSTLNPIIKLKIINNHLGVLNGNDRMKMG